MKIRYILSVGLFILSISVAYYFLIYLPRRDQVILRKDLQQFQIREERIRQKEVRLAQCLQEAEEIYMDSWREYCSASGMGEECYLPQDQADRVNGYRTELKDDCYKRFPQQ